jgi:hypothetical protein
MAVQFIPESLYVKHAVNMPQRRAMLLKLTAAFIWHLKVLSSEIDPDKIRLIR